MGSVFVFSSVEILFGDGSSFLNVILKVCALISFLCMSVSARSMLDRASLDDLYVLGVPRLS